MLSSLIGVAPNDHLTWLAETWWPDGPPVCILEGFPGVGKTQLAESLEQRLVATSKRPPLIAFCQCPPQGEGIGEDFLISLAAPFAEHGDLGLPNQISFETITEILFSPSLLVIDEFQDSFQRRTSEPPPAVTSWLEKLSRAHHLKGRVLLLTSRAVDGTQRWSERCEIRTLKGLSSADGRRFLKQSLRREGLPLNTIPEKRYSDVVSWLGGYPRALRLLVARLKWEPLDQLISREPESWEARDRSVSPDLVRKLEAMMLARASGALPHAANRFLERLAVFRRPIDIHGLRSVNTDEAVEGLRDELLSRFLMEHRRGLYMMHPVWREAVQLRTSEQIRIRSHRIAGEYYARHFAGRQIVGAPWHLGTSFLEARYHLSRSGDVTTLAEIVRSFEVHLRDVFAWGTPLPEDQSGVDELITLFSALLETPGAPQLHFYYARLLERRNSPGGADQALQEARLSCFGQSPADAWILRIRLEARCLGWEHAVRVGSEALRVCPQPGICHAVVDILESAEQRAEAIAFLEAAFNIVPASAELYVRAGKLLARDDKPDRAVGLLIEAIGRLRPEQRGSALYHLAAELWARQKRVDEAMALLTEGISTLGPEHNVFSLYHLAAELLARQNKVDEAVALLTKGVARCDSEHGGYNLAEGALIYGLAAGTLTESQVAGVLPKGRYRGIARRLADVLLCEQEQDWAQGARLVEQSLDEHRWCTTLFVRGAFCWLCLGDAERANLLLEKGAPSIEKVRDGSYSWLRCLIYTELRDHDRADEWLCKYLGRPLKNGEHASVAELLRFWATGTDLGHARAPSYDFPMLPRLIAKLQSRTTTLGPAERTDPEEPQASKRGPRWNYERIIHVMQPQGWPSLYVIGCFDRRITLYSQQVRALTLIRALVDATILEREMEVAIVGAGVAGVTAAVAAAGVGCKVSLFEERDAILPLQAAAKHRLLHPHLYDWPLPESMNPDAGLPLLNWTADFADQVIIGQLRPAFETLRQRCKGRLVFFPRTRIDAIERGTGQRQFQLVWNESLGKTHADVIVLAVGFGFELNPPSYWHGDDLDGAPRLRTILVSGTGDGGLVDLARAALRSDTSDTVFRQDQAVAWLTEDSGFQSLGEQALRLDNEARRESITRACEVDLFAKYEGLNVPASLIHRLTELKRSDTNVTFNYHDKALSLDSALINRLLAFLLIRAEIVAPLQGLLSPEVAKTKTGKAQVQVRSIGGRIRDCEFDVIVRRHGPDPLFFGRLFPNLDAACNQLRGKVADLQLTGVLDTDTMEWYKQRLLF